jgi:hypothetical protein
MVKEYYVTKNDVGVEVAYKIKHIRNPIIHASIFGKILACI